MSGFCSRQAMDKVAFLPFGLLVDKYRWRVFSGDITPANYNKGWNDLRLQYQGIVPPVARTEQDFDPGAKYHVPASVPYTRYFLARILQFQFYKAACDQAGWQGPLHRCSFYGNKEVGRRLNAMLAMGASKPWPDALEAFTGTREMSGDAMVEYFRPLMAWLQQQNRGRRCGWQGLTRPDCSVMKSVLGALALSAHDRRASRRAGCPGTRARRRTVRFGRPSTTGRSRRC